MELVDVDEGIVVGEDVDEDDGDDSDVEATQHETAELLKRIEKNKTGSHEPNEAEVIKSIDLINFMVFTALFLLSDISVTVAFTSLLETRSILSSATTVLENPLF
jgi:hypothetical protein